MTSIGFRTLLFKEVFRFWKVGLQTIAAPIVTALLYLLIFSHVLSEHIQVYPGVPYVAFLVPGLVMMSMLQNAFANSSSSLIQSKVTGNIVFVLLPPLSYLEFFMAYLVAAVVRGVVVGAGVFTVTAGFAAPAIAHPLWLSVFALAASAVFGALGIIAGIWADKFDQIAGFQNFIIVPLTFLSGVFYSIHSLPALWQTISRVNPVLYMVDGFRFGFFGRSDIAPQTSLLVVLACLAALSLVSLQILRSGYKLRH